MQARKKPIIINVIKLEKTFQSFQECYFFMKMYTHESTQMGQEKWYEFVSEHLNNDKGIYLKTLESDNETQLAKWGDYIIEGVEGEFYPCDEKIFEKTYEVMNENR